MKRTKNPRVTAHSRPITVNSYNELLQHEPAILKRIAATQNGGNLFMAHPLQLLSDIGVQLSKEVVNQLVQMYPELSALSLTPYEAIKAAGQQSVQFNVRGLFRRKG
jgi:hypothetical protein